VCVVHSHRITANLPDDAISEYTKLLQTGVHFGYARVVLGDGEGKSNEVLPMVMSLGWNPYYKNEKRTAVSDMRGGLKISADLV
jgi:riboflavin kinase